MKVANSAATVLSLLFFVCISFATQAQERVSTINADPTYIPAGSKLYVADIDGLPGFENNLIAALQKKRVNLIVVTDRSLADFEVEGFARSEEAGWAKTIFGSGLPESEASIRMVNLRTAVVAYAVASYKVNPRNGNKSTAEHLAKNLRQKNGT